MERKPEVQDVYSELELLNALIIGFMIGVYEIMGRGGTQAIANMAGQRIGQEIIRFTLDQGIDIQSLEDFRDFARDNKLMGGIEFHQTGDSIYACITDCHTCPKKVGHYQFDGTACPWGGILSGVCSEIIGERFSSSARLIPGEKCVLEIHKA